MASKVVRRGFQEVKPILSVNKIESKRRVLHLYKAWHRQVPYLVTNFHLPITEAQCKERVRSIFSKNKDITDLRVIDVLIIKGEKELLETINDWKQKSHVMMLLKGFHYDKQIPKDFLGKFYEGHES